MCGGCARECSLCSVNTSLAGVLPYLGVRRPPAECQPPPSISRATRRRRTSRASHPSCRRRPAPTHSAPTAAASDSGGGGTHRPSGGGDRRGSAWTYPEACWTTHPRASRRYCAAVQLRRVRWSRLAEGVAKKLPHGCSYKDRRRMPPQNKFVALEDRATPGTIDVAVRRPPPAQPPTYCHQPRSVGDGRAGQVQPAQPAPPSDSAPAAARIAGRSRRLHRSLSRRRLAAGSRAGTGRRTTRCCRALQMQTQRPRSTSAGGQAEAARGAVGGEVAAEVVAAMAGARGRASNVASLAIGPTRARRGGEG